MTAQVGALTATLWWEGVGRADSTSPADGWRHRPLVLTSWAGLPTHFTRGKVFQIAPGRGLPEAKPFFDVRQQVVNNAAIIRWG